MSALSSVMRHVSMAVVMGLAMVAAVYPASAVATSGYDAESTAASSGQVRLELLGHIQRNSLRDQQVVYQIGRSAGGFRHGEKVRWASTGGTIGRVSADGALIRDSWVTIPGETESILGICQDGTNVFSGNLIALTSSGKVWRIDSQGNVQRIAAIPGDPHGIAVAANDAAKYGPWAGRIIIGDSSTGRIHSIDSQGVVQSVVLGIQPQDIAIVASGEAFYGIAEAESALWHAGESEFVGMAGDILIAEKATGLLWRVRWNGTEFAKTFIAQGADWQRILFVDENSSEDPGNRVIVNQHSLLNSGKIEGSLWQLSGELFIATGSTEITGDLTLPGTPHVHMIGQAAIAGETLTGFGDDQPSGYGVYLTGATTVNNLVTRTDRMALPAVSAPSSPAGTRTVLIARSGQSIGNPATLRNLAVMGSPGAIVVPPGNYGSFMMSGTGSLVFGIPGATEPAIYSLHSLTLADRTHLQVAGPVILNVGAAITLTGSAVMGEATEHDRLKIKMSGRSLILSGSSTAYANVYAPSAVVTIGAVAKLSGSLACDHLIMSGGTIQVSIPNKAPVVDAGSDRDLEWPIHETTLLGSVTDDGLPAEMLTYSWSRVSGPGTVAFGNADEQTTTAMFSAVGAYVLRLMASDGELSSHSEVTVTVHPANLPPEVSAGSAQTIVLPATALLSGAVADDGLPLSGKLTFSWSKVSGPGAVVFSDPASANIEASFSAAGSYTLRLMASDSELTAHDDVVVTVLAPNQPPTVDAGANQTITLPSTAQLNGSASDDGLPQGSALVSTWSVASGSGTVTFGDAAAVSTAASFSTAGTYVLQLSVTDGALTSNATVTITVNSQPGEDLPPDPSTVAPPLDPTVATTMADAVSFLYMGPNPIQRGVDASAMNPMRLAVMKGKVFDREGNPLSGAKVSVLNHPEFGYTLSRLDGGYDMAVNGGGLLTVNIDKAGYLPAQRQKEVQWQSYTFPSNVRMVALDPEVTTVDLSAAQFQVARGSVVIDQDGRRQATMLFAPGTVATMKLPDGGTQSLSMIRVRATEYTVGSGGPEAMPAELPPQIGYTYAAEFSVDEALAAGAAEVQFSQPVTVYIDNFLSFPAGTGVPLGYYDRGKGVWVASDNGIVMKVLSISGPDNIAELDTNGDDVADNIGISDVERLQLGSLYHAGQSLWRVQISHFSPWDCNMPVIPPAGARAPNGRSPWVDPPTANSSVDYQNRIMGEQVAVVGTPFTIGYFSDRMPGNRFETRAEIPIEETELPESVKRIEVSAEVGGQIFKWALDPAPNQKVIVDWDGNDAYGRPLQGWKDMRFDIGYVYTPVYGNTDRFGYNGNGMPITVDSAREDIIIHQKFSKPVRSPQLSSLSKIQGLGGWTFDVHHMYEPIGKVLLKGDGTRLSAMSMNRVMRTAAGGGDPADGVGDGGVAQKARLGSPRGLAVSADGSLYIADSESNRVRRVLPNGIIETVAGDGSPCDLGSSACGEGGPATQAQINPVAIAVDRDGVLFVADNVNRRILKIGVDNVIHRFAGNGQPCSYSDSQNCGDNGPAESAGFANPVSIAIGPVGGVYVSDRDNNRIRRIGPDGIIHTVAGSGGGNFAGDGDQATGALINLPEGIAVGPDGSIYIADTANRRVRRVGPDGVIQTIAGREDFCPGDDLNAVAMREIGPMIIGPACYPLYFDESGDGKKAVDVSLLNPTNISVLGDGSVLVADTGVNRVRIVLPDGTIQVVAGGGERFGDLIDGASAGQSILGDPKGVAFDKHGKGFYIADTSAGRVLYAVPGLPEIKEDQIIIPSREGAESYVFDKSGRHLKTISEFTKSVLYEFRYTPDGLLSAIADGDGNATAVERTGDGVPVALIGPYGQRTSLALDGNGYLASITDPSGNAVSMTYSSDGLIATFKDANEHESHMTYDEIGLLIRNADAAGGFQDLQTLMEGDVAIVTLTTAEGQQSRIRTEEGYLGAYGQTFISPDGATVQRRTNKDASVDVTEADGTVNHLVEGPDPRFGMLAPIPVASVTVTPGGLSMNVEQTRTVELQNPDDPLSVRLTDRSVINGRAFTTRYDMTTKTFIDTTAAGREKTTRIDAQGRIVFSHVQGLAPVEYGYDDRGRLATISQGVGVVQRVTSLSYGSDGLLDHVTDPLERTIHYSYDNSGRVTNQRLPGGRNVSYAYDPTGNLTGVSPPSHPAHQFSYTPANLVATYAPPNLGAGSNLTMYQYNLDKQIRSIAHPDGRTTAISYDTAGRRSGIVTPGGQYTYGYDESGRISGISAFNGPSLSYAYDGSLPLSTSWSGAINGSVSRTFDNNFWVASQSVNGGSTVQFVYDDDGLLTGAGEMIINRDARNGLLMGSILGHVVDEWTYNGFGEPASYTAKVNGHQVFSIAYTRDNLGRIVEKSENLGGAATAYHYDYDTSGRITGVRRDGVATTHYEYDHGNEGNGNRTRMRRPLESKELDANYDDQDRMLSYGANSYSYTTNGELLSKTAPEGIANYEYDVMGNLRSVSLPNGMQIEYEIDGQNRRVGKKVNGMPVQGLLYDGQLQVAAELDGSGAVVSRFVYAERSNAPSYMIRRGVIYRIISDHLGSPRLVIDVAEGTIAQQIDYDEFGNVLSDTNPGFQPFGFAGGIYDQHTGLTRFGARDYDAESGRWTVKDPLLFEGGDVNLYGYVLGDPVNSIDPLGLAVGSQQQTPGSPKPTLNDAHIGRADPSRSKEAVCSHEATTAFALSFVPFGQSAYDVYYDGKGFSGMLSREPSLK